jgi:hypothetical protein
MSKVPFPFILELLYSQEPRVKPMFGAHAVYVREKIVLIMRNKETHPEANGIWIATSKEHHASLKKELPTMHSVYLLSDGKGETGWQMIHIEDENFEPAVTRVCELILKGDARIGRIPKKRK